MRRATAARRLDGLRERLRRSVTEATTLLDGDADSDAYSDFASA
jgi:hypothetical protein